MVINPKLRFSGIYCIINVYNGLTYIGSATNIYLRWHAHVRELKANKHGNVYLQSAFNKLGLIGLVFSVVETVQDKSKLLEREQFYMERFKSIAPNGYNILSKAGNRLGSIHSDETKIKLSLARKNRVTKPETRIKMSIAHSNRIMTEEHKNNLSKSSKGVPKSEAHKKAMSIGKRNRKDKLFETLLTMKSPIELF